MSRLNIRMLSRTRLATCAILIAAGLSGAGPVWAATLTVNNSADVIAEDDFCTLREAIINANNNDQSGSTDCAAGQALPTVDVIDFSGDTNNTPIVLTLTGAGENAAETGDLDITESVIINGNGANSVTEVDGNASDRVFDIRNGAEVQMLYVSVTNGGAVSAGAGINVLSGRLDMQDARVAANTISEGPSAGFVSGAGIRTLDVLRLTRVSVEDNVIEALGDLNGQGAGISVETGGSVGLTTSLVRNNTVQTENGAASGAGLFNSPNNVAVNTGISSSIFSGNQAISSADGSAAGGAINHQSGTLSIVRGVFVSNLARTAASGAIASGGALVAFDPVAIRNSTISANRAQSVDASWGGGLSLSDSATINNVTITDNRVQISASGSTSGGGLRGNATVEISNSVVAENTTSNSSPDCNGTITSAGYNLVGDNSGCNFLSGTGDQVGDVTGGGVAIDPMLAVLAHYGGSISIDGQQIPVLTHAPLFGSALIDAADPNDPGSGGTCEPLDQLGFGRPIDGDENGAAVCDIGAVEYSDALPAPPGSGGGFFGGGSSGGAVSPFFLLNLAGLVVFRSRRRS